MRNAHHLSVVGLLLLASGCSSGANGRSPLITEDDPSVARSPGKPPVLVEHTAASNPSSQSFLPPSTLVSGLSGSDGWTAATPRLLADVDGDKKQDVVGFGYDGVWIAKSNGATSAATYVLAGFGSNQGWSIDQHVRLLGDIDGDGKDDIVGFGDDGVSTSLSTGEGFAPAQLVIGDLGYSQGWRVDRDERVLADVNGDGKKDIVAFGDAGVYVSLATGGGNFESTPRFVLAAFGGAQGWDPAKHIRLVADVNGDGKDDIVGFGDDGVTVSYSDGSGFGAAVFAVADFNYNAGWHGAADPRMLADINHDGRKDIVGFGDDGVWVSLNTGSGFAAAKHEISDFGVNQGWDSTKHARFVADLDGDGYADIVGFKDDAIYRALGGPNGFTGSLGVLRALTANYGYSSADYPRFLGDIDGDGLPDAVAFGQTAVEWAKSTPNP